MDPPTFVSGLIKQPTSNVVCRTMVDENVLTSPREYFSTVPRSVVYLLELRIEGFYIGFSISSIPLTNPVFLLWFKLTGIKRGSVTCSTDRENEVSKIFVISLTLIGCAGKESSWSQVATYKFSRPYNGIRPANLTNHSACTNWELQ